MKLRLSPCSAEGGSELLEKIDGSKNVGLAGVLMGLGIRFVGERTAGLLAA